MARDVTDEPTHVQGYPYRGGPVLDIEHTDSIPPAPPAPPPPRRGIWPWLVALLVLVILGLGALYAFADRGSPSKERGPGLAATPTPTPPASTRPHVPRTHKKKKLKPAIPVKKPKPNVTPLVVVPGVVGLPKSDAETTLSRVGLRTTIDHIPSSQPSGRVVSQHPGSGSEARRGTTVLLNISQGKSTGTPQTAKKVPAPNLIGKTLTSARRILQAQGLRIEVRRVPSSKPADTVLGQSPRPGVTVPRGAVFVTVSKGQPQATGVVVPDVIGEDQSTATSDLQAAGFTVSTLSQTTTDPTQDGTVVAEQPSGGTRAARGSKVTITVARYQGG